MKRRISFALSRCPLVYRSLLRMLGRNCPEKLAFLSLIKDGDVVMDIGANYGDFTNLFSDIVGSKGEVHAFEPVPSTFLKLIRRIEDEQNYSNVFLNKFALGDKPGTFEIHVPAGDFGQASLKKHSAGSWSKAAVEVDVTQVLQAR